MPRWKGQTGFNKDKHKGSWWAVTPMKKIWKHVTKRKHRQKERLAIIHEEYDELSSTSYHDSEDLWNWD